MDLQFTKVGETYIADYSATTHFNIHIEGGGRVELYRRTSGEKGVRIASIPAHADIDIAVNFPATYTILLSEKASLVVLTTAEGETIEGVIPSEPSGEGDADIPEGYAHFITADDMIFSASDGAFYVKL